MVRDVPRRLLAAVIAAIYWYAAAWLCFLATGHDPLDAIGGVDASPAARIGAAIIVAAAVAGYALAARAWSGGRARA